tara:strand:+ start:1011 stop:1283 length:273 start_codon:yes stop_codon:yes gene_type:complete
LGEKTIGSEATTATNLLSIARVLRLVRLFVVMNKVQKARAAYKKTKYLKTGSPVERVIDLLGDMKGKVEDDTPLTLALTLTLTLTTDPNP